MYPIAFFSTIPEFSTEHFIVIDKVIPPKVLELCFS